MQKNELIALIPYFLSLLISISVGYFVLRRRHVIGAWSFALIIFIEVLTTVGFILELVSPGLPGKIFWDNFQWFTSMVFPVALLVFVFKFTGKLNSSSIRLISILLLIALLFATIISFNFFPGFGILSPHLISGQPFSIYTYIFGPIIILGSLFIYLVTLAVVILLVKEIIRQQKNFRNQTIIIILGIIVPVVGSILAVVGIDVFPNRDISPLTLAVANLILFYGLFHYRIFDIIPIARGAVMDHMTDSVVILNQNDIILDVNSSFEKLIGIQKKLLINKSIHDYISSTVLTKQEFQLPIDVQDEGLLHYGDNLGYFDISIKTFLNRHDVYSGRLIIFHDLTTRKLNENQLLLRQDILEENAAVRALELEQLNTLLVSEVAERKKAEKEKDNYAQEMEVLFNLAIEISELGAGVDIEEFLAKRLKEINQAFFVVLSEYDPEKKVLYPKHIVIDDKSMEKVIEIVGEDPTKIYLRVDDETYRRISKEVVMYRQNLNQSFYGVIDPSVGDRIQLTFALDQFIGVSIQSNGKLAASLVIALQKNTVVPSAKFYESLANLASVVFWRK